LLGLVVLAVVYAYIRGNWADTTIRNPASVADGPLSQLYQTPDHRKQVRCSILLPYSRERVWAAVSDYAHYADFLPYLADIEVAPNPEGPGWRMTGQAQSLVSGHWPFTIHISEDKKESEWSIGWDEMGDGPVKLNRGGWTLSAHDRETTLLVLTLETQVLHYPNFVLRNVFLHRLKRVVRAVEQHVQNQPAPAP
jgi:ribosome-associated toxin RatA of RatAB toxin-antitoxin module